MRFYRVREFFVTQIKIITRHRFGTFGAVVLLLFALIGLLAPVITPHDPLGFLTGCRREAGDAQTAKLGVSFGHHHDGQGHLESDDPGHPHHCYYRAGIRADIDSDRCQYWALVSVLRGQTRRGNDAFYRHCLWNAVFTLPHCTHLSFWPQHVVCHYRYLLYCLANFCPCG